MTRQSRDDLVNPHRARQTSPPHDQTSGSVWEDCCYSDKIQFTPMYQSTLFTHPKC